MAEILGHPLALVTGASSGIGFELAKLLAAKGYDLVVAADRPLGDVEEAVRIAGADVALSMEVDLSKAEAIDVLVARVRELGRPIDILCANAGHGLVDKI